MSRPQFDGEEKVHGYLTGLGLRVERFSKADLRSGRTPDFKVFDGAALAFYCEVKTAQKDELLERLTAAAPFGVMVGGGRADPTYNRIAQYVHKAVGQFDAVNPDVAVPNVLFIVNNEREAEFTDLIQVLTGNAYCEGGDVLPWFRGWSEGRIREEKFRIHLYVWWNDWTEREPQKFYSEYHVAHHALLCRHFKADTTRMKRL